MNAHLPLGNRSTLCLISRYHASKKKDQTSETVFRKQCQQLRQQHNSYFGASINGSKWQQKVASATFYPKNPDDIGAVRS